MPHVDRQLMAKLYSKEFLSDQETLARQAGEDIGIARIWGLRISTLLGSRKTQEGLVPGYVRNDISKVQ